MKTLLAFLLVTLLSPSLVQAAANAVISWTHPTEYTDGSALPLSEIAETRLKCGNQAGGPYPNTYIIPAPETTANARDHVAEGDWFCVATTVSIQGVEGVASNEANFTLTPRVPAAPVLTVN